MKRMMKMKERANVLTTKPLLTKAAEFIKDKRKDIIYGLVYGALTFLFGRAELLFETSPLGIAFVCASRDGIPFTVAGMVVAALTSKGEQSVVYLSGLIVAVGFRYALSFVLHRKSASVYRLNDGYAARISSSAAGAVTVSAVTAASDITICSRARFSSYARAARSTHIPALRIRKTRIRKSTRRVSPPCCSRSSCR